MKLTFAVFLSIVLFVSLSSSVHAQYEVKTYVNDYAGVLSENDTARITSVAQQIFDSGAAQYAIVIVPNLGGRDIESFSMDIAQGNLGDTKKDNGLLLLIAVEDRQYRFEVGSGLEGQLNDAKIGRIGRQNLVPAFQAGDYGGGVLSASEAIAYNLNVSGYDPSSDSGYIPEVDPKTVITAVIIAIIIFILLIIILAKIGKKLKGKVKPEDAWWLIFLGGKGGGGSGGLGGGGFGGGGFSGGGSSGRW